MIPMQLEDILDQQIYDEGIIVETQDLSAAHADGLYYSADDISSPVITLHSGLMTTHHKNYVKAHELGHHRNCVRNLFEAPKWLRQKYELLADRDWIRRLMAPGALVAAYENGVRNPFDLSEYLQIPLEALMKGISICYEQYGPVTHYGQYCIYWNPFNIKIDMRRKVL